jgi:hypothetical protein
LRHQFIDSFSASLAELSSDDQEACSALPSGNEFQMLKLREVRTSNQNWGIGNSGVPYTSISAWTVYPPFAATTPAGRQ